MTPLRLTPAHRVDAAHRVLIGAPCGTVHCIDRDHTDLPAIYGAALPDLLAGRTVTIGNTRHVSVSALAMESMR